MGGDTSTTPGSLVLRLMLYDESLSVKVGAEIGFWLKKSLIDVVKVG